MTAKDIDLEYEKQLHQDLVTCHISAFLSGEKMSKEDNAACRKFIYETCIKAAQFIDAFMDDKINTNLTHPADVLNKPEKLNTSAALNIVDSAITECIDGFYGISVEELQTIRSALDRCAQVADYTNLLKDARGAFNKISYMISQGIRQLAIDLADYQHDKLTQALGDTGETK